MDKLLRCSIIGAETPLIYFLLKLLIWILFRYFKSFCKNLFLIMGRCVCLHVGMCTWGIAQRLEGWFPELESETAVNCLIWVLKPNSGMTLVFLRPSKLVKQGNSLMRNLNTSNQSEALSVSWDYTLSYGYEITDIHTTQ